ncbi:MAG: leucine-rich repeat domain-containing protein [Planctomycetota bacterium]
MKCRHRRLFAIMLFCFLVVTASPTMAQTDQETASQKVDQPNSIFPDKALEKAIRAEVFEKRFNDDPITVDDVAKISRVVASGKGIKSLEGLQHCGSLMLIDLSNNRITDLRPLAKLTRLQSVTLSGNLISNIQPLAKLTAMQLLDLSGNQLTSLNAIEGMHNLRTLYAADNELTEIEPVAGLEKIWSLDVAGNRLTDLKPLSNLTWLTTVEVSDNKIESLSPLKGLRDLDLLILSGNPLSSIDPLVDMCQADAEGDRRFAPYLDVYLTPEQMESSALVDGLERLRRLGVRLHEYQRSVPARK